MTWTARFKVEDVGEGPAPINILAVARVEDGTLIQNTEHATVMELNILLDVNETSIKIGDEITGSGSFSSG